MYIFLTIFFVYVITFLFKKDSKLLGDFDYFSRNNIFGLNNNNSSKESDSEYEDNEISTDNDSNNSEYEDNEINTDDDEEIDDSYDKISENEYKND